MTIPSVLGWPGRRRDDQTDILHTRPTRPPVRAIVRHHFIDPEEDGGRGERLLKRTRNTDYGADAAADTAAVAVVSSCKIMSTGAASGEEEAGGLSIASRSV